MFNEQIIQQVWDKATIVDGYNPNLWRQDFAGAWIRRDSYGTTMNFGWEIDHLHPVSIGGGDNIGNLSPIHCRNNRKKGNDFPEFYTEISSYENRNIDKLQSWIVKI